MDRQMLDRGLPVLYGILVVALAMTIGGKTVGIFTVVGAMLLGLYYSAIRPSLIRKEQDDRGPTAV